MNDVGKLRGLNPIGPALNRVRRPPKKRKPGDRPNKRNDQRRQKGHEEELEEAALGGVDISVGDFETQEEDLETLQYNADGVSKSRKHKIDLVI
jgi:hypothetical protein